MDASPSESQKCAILAFETAMAGVDMSDATVCWLWPRSSRTKSYGAVYAAGRQLPAHRVSYARAHGWDALTPGLYVCHVCDTPACVNPHHLWLGTATANTKDAQNKGRLRSGRAKLKRREVLFIRKNANSERGRAICMLMFNISYLSVRHVASGKYYKHITD